MISSVEKRRLPTISNVPTWYGRPRPPSAEDRLARDAVGHQGVGQDLEIDVAPVAVPLGQASRGCPASTLSSLYSPFRNHQKPSGLVAMPLTMSLSLERPALPSIHLADRDAVPSFTSKIDPHLVDVRGSSSVTFTCAA